MGIKKSFKAKLYVDGSEVLTSGDITLSVSVGKHEIKTRESEITRNLPGFMTYEVSATVYAGTLSGGSGGGSDSYSDLYEKFQSRETFPVQFQDGSSGISFTENMFVSDFKVNTPVDGVLSAEVSFALSAADVGSDSPGGGSGSGY